MLITFISKQKKSAVLKLYFPKKSAPFCGKAISVFPYVAKTTQLWHSAFLQLKPKVLAAGAKFYLKFPCKRMVAHSGK